MSWLMAKFYDRVMEPTEAACLADWRAELLQSATGDVLEVGSGTGVNIAHYPSSVRSVTFTEPDPHMRAQLDERLRERNLAFDHRVVDCPAEQLPFDDDSFDTVVTTLVLCSVDDPQQAIAQLKRVLRPEGRLIYLEHVAAEPGTRRHLWQRIVEPAWKLVAGNCHVTRDTGGALREAGFELMEVERASMRKAPSFVRPTIRGVARLTSAS